MTRALMDEAIEAGFEAILVTVDAPPGGNRERDRRNRFTLPQELGVAEPRPRPLGGDRALTIEETFALMNHALDLGRRRGPRLRVQRPGPRQGRAHRRGRGAGASSTAPPASSSPTTAAASSTARSPPPTPCRRSPTRSTAARTLLVDGGIRRGIDVAIALALGADAVLVGRPALWGLAAGGERGRRRASSSCCARSSS